MPRLDFVPSRDGWHFQNGFETRILPGVVQDVKTSGLCGGMVMSALDYWRAKVPIPLHEPADLPLDPTGFRLPDEASRLRRYIFDRQMNTFLTGLTITRWLPAPWLRPEWFHDWAVNAEFNVVRQQLEMGRPAILGLWGWDDWNTGHQVLCYGFDTNPIRLYVYDPNEPDQESVLTPVSPAEGVRLACPAAGRESQYRGYFWMNVYNWAENPPYTPPYKDITITQGLSSTPTGPDAQVGGRLQLSVTVRNQGEYPSRFRAFVVWARDPVGRNVDSWVGGIEQGLTGLQPGEQRTVVRDVPSFGQATGVHTIGVSRESSHGHWQDVAPDSPGAASRRQLRLWAARSKVVDTWVDVPESARADVDTGITLQPGDDFELQGTGAIWAGVWFTGTNGPEGWTNRIETNPNSPMSGRPQAHPFALIGRFGAEPYFYIGTGLPRQAFRGTTPATLALRINDNAPANGSGAFRCRIQVWR
jgi:hypothetical protein